MTDRTPETILEQAFAYARMGWRLIPVYNVQADGSCACGRPDAADPDKHAIGKHPVGAKWQERASSAGPDLVEWFGSRVQNLGIMTGEESGIWVLDIDPDHDGNASLEALEAEHGLLPETRVHESGSGGRHFFFRWPGFDVANIQNDGRRLGAGIDVRGRHGQVVAPPSVSGKGGYRILSDADVADAPEWLLDLVRKPEHTPSTEVAARLAKAPDGYVDTALTLEVESFKKVTANRNDALNRHAFKIATMLPHGVITRAQIWDAFRPAALDMGLGSSEIDKTLESACKGGESKPRDWPPEDKTAGLAFPYEADKPEWPKRTWDDFGNGMRLFDHWPDSLLWIDLANRWAAYEDTRWSMDETNTAQRLTMQTIQSLPLTEALSYSSAPGTNAKGEETPSEREKFLDWVRGQRFVGKVRAMMDAAKGIKGKAARITDFDPDPWLLNCPNGVLDLKEVRMIEHAPDLMLMNQTNVEFDPNAECPLWDAFIERMQPDADVRDYLQRALGYSLSGDISEQKVFMHLGEGANGKSVMVEVIQHLMGSYGQTIPRTTLVVTKHDQIPVDVARMIGKRFLQASESGKGRVLDEEQVKSLCGGEEQAARLMKQNFFDFKPTGKIHYITNHFPQVSEAPSIWRRIEIIKWPVVIADTDPSRDRLLAQKIIATELPGVLAWMVRGLERYHKSGLEAPVQMEMWKAEYRSDSDEFLEFIEDVITRDSSVAHVPTQHVYDAYKLWVERGGRGRPMSVKAFSSALKERGFESKTGYTDGKRQRGFAGITLRSTGVMF